MSQEPKVIYLKDYTVPSFLIESTELRFELFEEETIVHAELKVKRNPACEKSVASLELFGHQELELIELTVDGSALDEKSVQREGELLILNSLPEAFVLKSSTRIHPETNTALEGLYKSDGMFCTQCEAEGFRRITFFPIVQM